MLLNQRDMQDIVRFTSLYVRRKTLDLGADISQIELTRIVEGVAEKIAYTLSCEIADWKKAKDIECELQEPDGIY
jgi:hypothetical protein